MLGKLMKFEFRATGRIFLPMYAALLVVAVINRIFMKTSFQLPVMIGTFVSVFMISAICVSTLILTIQRFNKNFLSNEGYLMFTLPVKTDSLILSKLFVSAIWFIVSAIVVMLAIAVMSSLRITLKDFFSIFESFFKSTGIERLNMVLFCLEFISVSLLSLFSGILMLYSCLSVSILFNKHRWLYAFGAFIAFNIIIQITLSIIIKIASAININNIFIMLSNLAMVHTIFGITIFSFLVLCAVFYLITRYMLVHKLNLE